MTTTTMTLYQQLLISFDLEHFGEDPQRYSMVEFAFVAIDIETHQEIETFSVCLTPRPGKAEIEDRCDKEFWVKYPENLAAIEKEMIHPAEAMNKVRLALESLKRRSKEPLIYLAQPISHDWIYLKAYWNEFFPDRIETLGLGYRAECLSTMFNVYASILKIGRYELISWIDQQIPKNTCPHRALPDAIHQGNQWKRMDELIQGKRKHPKDVLIRLECSICHTPDRYKGLVSERKFICTAPGCVAALKQHIG